MQIEMVCAHNKINRTCKDDPTGRSTRWEKGRQTEKGDGKTTYQNTIIVIIMTGREARKIIKSI